MLPHALMLAAAVMTFPPPVDPDRVLTAAVVSPPPEEVPQADSTTAAAAARRGSDRRRKMLELPRLGERVGAGAVMRSRRVLAQELIRNGTGCQYRFESGYRRLMTSGTLPTTGNGIEACRTGRTTPSAALRRLNLRGAAGQQLLADDGHEIRLETATKVARWRT